MNPTLLIIGAIIAYFFYKNKNQITTATYAGTVGTMSQAVANSRVASGLYRFSSDGKFVIRNSDNVQWAILEKMTTPEFPISGTMLQSYYNANVDTDNFINTYEVITRGGNLYVFNRSTKKYYQVVPG